MNQTDDRDGSVLDRGIEEGVDHSSEALSVGARCSVQGSPQHRGGARRGSRVTL